MEGGPVVHGTCRSSLVAASSCIALARAARHSTRGGAEKETSKPVWRNEAAESESKPSYVRAQSVERQPHPLHVV